MHDELERLRDLLGTKTNEYELSSPTEDPPFSLYLRSRSLSYSPATGIYDENNDYGSLPS